MSRFIYSVLLITFYMFFFLHSNASHLVGGQFHMTYLKSSPKGVKTFKLVLSTYFDDVNGNPDILEEELLVKPYIYERATSSLMTIAKLNRVDPINLATGSIENCSVEGLKTRIVQFEGEIRLDPDKFDDPEGYVIIWERCCRNATITNLESPMTTGHKFVLEFPPIVREGRNFYNSSPIMENLPSDYGCVGQPMSLKYNVSDSDGDSLVFSLVRPYNSSDESSVPRPHIHEFHEVTWAEGIDDNNMIPGSPKLNIDKSGVLSVTPLNIGLFSYAIKIDEYRNNTKIGTVRHDYQVMITDDCDISNVPELNLRLKNGQTFNELDTLVFDDQSGYCVDLFVKNNGSEANLDLRAVGVNFDAPVDSDIFEFSKLVVSENSEVSLEVCFSNCPYVYEGVQTIDLLAGFEQCPLPEYDTIRVFMSIDSQQNSPPYFVGDRRSENIGLSTNGVYSTQFTARDPDGDRMSIIPTIKGRNLEDLGVATSITRDEDGWLEGTIEWVPKCDGCMLISDQVFDLELTLTDDDSCNDDKSDLFIYHFDYTHNINIAPFIIDLKDVVVEREDEDVRVEFYIEDDFTLVEDIEVSIESSEDRFIENNDISFRLTHGKFEMYAPLIISIYEQSAISITAFDGELSRTETFNIRKRRITDIDDIVVESGPKIYPNPVSNTIFLDFQCPAICDVIVFDIKGNVVLQESSRLLSEREYDLSILKNGMYFIQLVDGEKVWLKKILKN